MINLNSVIMATVADEPLSLEELLRRLRQRTELKPLLVAAAMEKVVLGAARQAGLHATVAELQQAANRFRYEHGLLKAEQTVRWLSAQGLTLADLEERVEGDLLRGKFQRHLAVPRLEEHFAAHAGRYAKVQLRQMVVATEEAAGELRHQLTDEGGNFAALAREHSLHGPSRLAGGSIGLIPRHRLPPAIATAVFAAEPGAVVGPLLTSEGWILFLVEAMHSPELDEDTAAVIGEELFQAWLAEKLRSLQFDWSWLDQTDGERESDSRPVAAWQESL